MEHLNLTEGAIAFLSSGEVTQDDIKPILQIADVRLLSAQKQSTVDRYRILLSDGSHSIQGMLATQLNDLVRSGHLQKGSIIKLTQFTCNLVQNRLIIIMISLDVILEKCDLIGEPRSCPDGNPSSMGRTSTPSQSMNQPAASSVNPLSYGGSTMTGSAPRPNFGGSSLAVGMEYNTANAVPTYPKPEYGSGVLQAPANNHVRPQPSYNQPPPTSYNQPRPMFANRGPIAKNEAPPRIMPIAALNPYQGRWTIKARVTVKSELRHYNNARGDGKVFSFDLLDSEGGEIRVTCFNDMADQLYNQIEQGRIYMISRGNLKPAQKNFNHLRNDYEIVLDNASTVQPCFEDDQSIPKLQFHYRPISDIKGLENSSVVDVIGVVTSISPSSSIMRKNGTETLKRTLQLKDMSGTSVEVTLWGNFCNTDGLKLQNMCDSGMYPVLALKSGRVNDFNGKSVGTIASSQLFIEPYEFPEAKRLREWFDGEGKSTPAVSISISRDTKAVRKTTSQIKDEKLGTSKDPDWITVAATVTFIKLDNFYYTACPNKNGDRQCNKKVSPNGDGTWHCENCNKTVDACDFRYILQMIIQDHTGSTWVTAFQEGAEEIMGISAKDLHTLKNEEQDDERYAEVVRSALFTKFIFKLKVKEEIYNDESRVKSTVVKAEKQNVTEETRYLLGSIAKLEQGDYGSLAPRSEHILTAPGVSSMPGKNYIGMNSSNMARDGGMYTSQAGSFGGNHQSGGSSNYMNCTSCGGSGHNSTNCPSLASGPRQSYGSSGYGSNATPRPSAGGSGTSGECYKCHQFGHWARDCPGGNNSSVPPAYGSSNMGPGRYNNNMAHNQRVGF